jgi:hypothetical protein
MQPAVVILVYAAKANGFQNLNPVGGDMKQA